MKTKEITKRRKDNVNKMIKKNTGITLIALVVTIIVLIILAVISINLVFNEGGIINKSERAREISEMAQIKEEADFVKLGLNIDTLTQQKDVSFIQKSKLISELNKHFEGSAIEDGRVILKDGKYDIIVKNNLDIVVVKHGENYLKDDEIGITYEVEDVNEKNKTIKVYLEVGEVETKLYEEYAREKLVGKTETEKEQMLIEAKKYYGDTLEEGLDCTDFVEYMSNDYGDYGFDEGEAPTTLEELRKWVNANWVDIPFETVDEMLIAFGYVYPEQYDTLDLEEITVTCSNGETKTTDLTDLYTEFTVSSNGSYTIIATTESGKRGEVQIEITGIYKKEKFSRIYKETKEYTDGNNTATIPAGYAVGVSEGINTIEKGLVITDSVDSEGYSNGNEWVWVPIKDVNVMCDTANTTEYTLCGTSGETAVKTKLYSKSEIISRRTRTTPGTTTNSREPDLVTEEDAANYKTILGESGTKEDLAQLFVDEYKEMLESVGQYKGFYIGRYELTANGEKPGATLTNKNWYNLYNKCKEFGANDKVKSRMIWGCQWDVTCKWLAETEFASDPSKVYSNSSSWGNYYDSTDNAKVVVNGENKYGEKQYTGFSEYWKANNIYDFAGNCSEWTQEAVDDWARILRGGHCSSRSSSNQASNIEYGDVGDPTNDGWWMRFSSNFDSSRDT